MIKSRVRQAGIVLLLVCSAGCTHFLEMDRSDQEGFVLLSSDFSEEGGDKWWGAETNLRWIESEELHHACIETHWLGTVLPGQFDDFALRTRLRFVESSSSEFLAGIRFRSYYHDLHDSVVCRYYLLGLGQFGSGGRECYLWYFDGNDYEVIAHESCTPLSVTGAWNDIELLVEKYRIRVTVNGTVVSDLLDASNVGFGGISLRCWSYDGRDFEIAFDDLEISVPGS